MLKRRKDENNQQEAEIGPFFIKKQYAEDDSNQVSEFCHNSCHLGRPP